MAGVQVLPIFHLILSAASAGFKATKTKQVIVIADKPKRKILFFIFSSFFMKMKWLTQLTKPMLINHLLSFARILVPNANFSDSVRYLRITPVLVYQIFRRANFPKSFDINNNMNLLGSYGTVLEVELLSYFKDACTKKENISLG